MQRTEIGKVLPKILHPAKITLAICPDKDGIPNIITLEWFMRTSINPVMFAVSIGHSRYSYECFSHSEVFNLVYPSKEMAAGVVLCGSKSGREINKLDETGFEHFPGRLDNLPILKQAVANIECKIVTQVKSGDHTIFVGEVKHSYINNEKELLLYEDLQKI